MKFSPLTSRAAALGFLLLALAAVWSVVAPAFSYLADDRHVINAANLSLQRNESLLAIMPEIRSHLHQLEMSPRNQRALYEGRDRALLAAEFQRSVQKILAHTQTDLGSSETEPVRPVKEFLKLGLNLNLTASAAGLQRLLYDLETASPTVSVEHLSVRVPESGIELPQTSDGQPRLSIGLELSAYARDTSEAGAK